MTSSNLFGTLALSVLLHNNGVVLFGCVATTQYVNNKNNTCTSTPRNSTTPCIFKTCYHGDCVVKEIAFNFGFMKTSLCVCDLGWGGPECDICCDLYCDLEHPCKVYFHPKSSGYLQKCTASRDSEARKKTSSRLTDTMSHNKSCNSRKRNSTHQCVGLECYHGDCITKQPINRPMCKCDKGWSGKHCDECCDLDCPQGQCVIETTISGKVMQCSVSKTHIYKQTLVSQKSTTQQRRSHVSQLYLFRKSGLVRSNSETTLQTHNSTNVCKSTPRPSSVACGKTLCYHGNCTTTNKQYHAIRVITWSCACDKGWYGPDCNLCCDLQCNHGNCRISEGIPQCNCDPGYTGTLCDDKVPLTTHATRNVTVTVVEERVPSWYWYVVGAGITAVLALMTSLVVLPLYLWQKRNIFILTVVRCFQSPEDSSDGKLYDAYVSYSDGCSRDEAFCVHTLYPKLEKDLHFELYLPFRDTLPGNVRAETILWATQNSRRTILLVSPEYLQDEWPRFEYLTAQQEMLSLRHRIIPVILRDIDHVTIVDPVLKHLMTSLRCIKWPAKGDARKQTEFWKRLELALPKKRPRDRSNLTNARHIMTDETNTDNSGRSQVLNPQRWFSRRAREIITSV